MECLVEKGEEVVGEFEPVDGVEEVGVCSLHEKENEFSAPGEGEHILYFSDSETDYEFVGVGSEEVEPLRVSHQHSSLRLSQILEVLDFCRKDIPVFTCSCL